MKPASLSARVTVLLTIVALLVLGGGAKLMDWRIDHAMASRFRQDLLSQARALGNMVALEQGVPAGRAATGLTGGDSWYELRCDGAPVRRSDPPPPAVPKGWPDDTDSQPRFARLGHHEHHLESVRLSFPRPVGEDDEGHIAANAAPATCRLLFLQDRHSLDQLLLAI